MIYAIENIAKNLKEARARKGLSAAPPNNAADISTCISNHTSAR